MPINSREAGEDTSSWTRRQFVAASGVAALVGHAARPITAAQPELPEAATTQAINFPKSFLYCSPNDSGIWVRVQMECRGCLTDATTGQTDEYVLGVMAKTGLSPDPRTGGLAPGYDYWIIFSNSHVFTKRSHSSAYLNNPTVLEHKDFGEAKWHLQQVPAEALRSASDVRKALEGWREMTARTTFTSADGARRFTVEYPVKWADFTLKSDGFRVETGPVFLLDPDRLRVGQVPAFADFQWAHFDCRTFHTVRCLLEQPTSILADATFVPPAENGRQVRETKAITAKQLDELRRAIYSDQQAHLSPETLNSLLSTDHYSQVKEFAVTSEMYARAD